MKNSKEILVLIIGVVAIFSFIGFLIFQATEFTKTSVEKKRIKLDSTLLYRVEKLESQDSIIIETLTRIDNKITDYQSRQKNLVNNHNVLRSRLKKLESKQDNIEVIE